MRFIDEHETVLYQLRKSKMPILFMIIFFPIWMYFGSLFLRPFFQSVFGGETALTHAEYYQAGMIGLVLFIPLVIVISLSYFLNQLIITDQRIYIRKGMIGKIYIVKLGDIRSFQHVISSGKNKSNNSILFYLLCGKKIKTGDLYITMSSLQALLEILREKFEGLGFTKLELTQLRQQNANAGQPLAKTNLLVLLLVLSPWILALILTFSYLGSV